MPNDALAFEEIEHILDCADLFQFVIGDLDVEGFLHLHDEFNEIEGIGFKTADRIAKSLGIAGDDIRVMPADRVFHSSAPSGNLAGAEASD